jgi:hypothetical protein
LSNAVKYTTEPTNVMLPGVVLVGSVTHGLRQGDGLQIGSSARPTSDVSAGAAPQLSNAVAVAKSPRSRTRTRGWCRFMHRTGAGISRLR